MTYSRSVLQGKDLGVVNTIDWPNTLDQDSRTTGVHCTIIIEDVGSVSPKRCTGKYTKCTQRVTVWCLFAQWLTFLRGWLLTLSKSVLCLIVISWNDICCIPHSFSKYCCSHMFFHEVFQDRKWQHGTRAANNCACQLDYLQFSSFVTNLNSLWNSRIYAWCIIIHFCWWYLSVIKPTHFLLPSTVIHYTE